ncbi:hypothetical protein AGMMS49938_16150 [Fibrobacterales bacterium]|nr:hypothetical protein AGMMS49938_16150 [Fibrobacterales bacterium]
MTQSVNAVWIECTISIISSQHLLANFIIFVKKLSQCRFSNYFYAVEISEILDDNADFILQACLRFVKTISAAQDVRQEVFLKVMNNAGKFREESSVRTWLWKICYHCCMDYFRKKKRDNRLINEFSHLQDGFASDSSEPIWEVHSISDMQCPISQLMLELHYEEEWSCDEISAVFGLDSSVVRHRISNGISQLQEALGEGRKKCKVESVK